MPTIRAPLNAVLDTVRAGLLADAKATAGNHLLSRAEAQALPDGLLKDAHEALRLRGGSGARVTVAEAADEALEQVRRHIAAINQATGSGAAIVAREEIVRLQGVHAETAARAAKAWQLLTGRTVALDGQVPAPPQTALPDAGRTALMDTLVDHFGLARAARVDLTDVVARDGGHALKVRSNVFTGDVFVKESGGRFLVMPKPVDDATLDKVRSAALAYFDAGFARDMGDWGASRAEIAAARAAFVPERALLAGESDPHDLASTSVVVFQIDNQSGSDHGVYAGVDAHGDVDVYAFN